MHLGGLVQALSWNEFLQVEIYCDLLVGEGEVQQEKVVHSHERDRVDEAFGIKETLEVVVLVVALDVLFKLVYVEISLSMPLLIFEILQISDGVLACEARLEVETGCFKGSVVNNWKDVGVGVSGVHNLLPEVAVRVLCEKEVVDGVEQRWVVKTIHDGL